MTMSDEWRQIVQEFDAEAEYLRAIAAQKRHARQTLIFGWLSLVCAGISIACFLYILLI